MTCPAAKPAALLGWLLRAAWPPMKKLPSSCSSIGPPSDPAVAAEIPNERTPSANPATPITMPPAKTEASCRVMLFCMSSSLALGQFLPYRALQKLILGHLVTVGQLQFAVRLAALIGSAHFLISLSIKACR